MKMSLLVTSNIPSPYFLNYLNCLSDEFEIDVVFELKNASDRKKDWASSFKPKPSLHIFYSKSIRTGAETGLSFGLSKFVKRKKYERIIVANPTTPSGIVFINYLKRKGIPFCIQSEGGFVGSGNGLKEKFKKKLMSGAVFYLTGMGKEDDYFLKYGATLDTLKPYPFTSIFEEELKKRRKMSIGNKDIRSTLKMPIDKTIIISVGRVLPVKGYDFLLDVVLKLNPNLFEFYIIGGMPTKQMMAKIKKEKLDNVHFVEFVDSSVVSMYYQSADLFVFTTRGDTWGLVINEAMSYGLPVVTSNMAIAARYLIKNGINGFICDYNSTSQFVESILKITTNDTLKEEISLNNKRDISDFYLENMAYMISNYLKKDWIKNE